MTSPANVGQVERVLEDLITKLTKRESTAEVRAALIEARRLKAVMTRWAAIPPPPDARREMLARVMELTSQTGAAVSGPPPAGFSEPPPARRLHDARTADHGPSNPPPAPEPGRRTTAPASEERMKQSLPPVLEPPTKERKREAREAPGTAPSHRHRPSESDRPPARLPSPSPPGVVARGLTPTPRSPPKLEPPRSRAPSPAPAMRSGRPMSPPDAFDSPMPPTPRSRTGASVPPISGAPPPLRGRKASTMPGSLRAVSSRPSRPPSEDDAARAFGSPGRVQTKTGIAEAEERDSVPPQRGRRSSAPTAPPPPGMLSSWPGRRETKMMGSQGVTEALEALADAKNPKLPSADSFGADSDRQRRVNAVGNYREGGLEGLSSAISSPAMEVARSARPAKQPSNPTLQMTTPIPPATRSSQPPPSFDKPLRTVVSPGVTIVRPDAAQWQPHPVIPGVTVKLLYRDARSGIYTALLRLAPGSTLPRRRHAAAEELLLVAGIAKVGAHELRAGEYCRAEADTVHDAVTTTTGCTLFVCGSENDDYLEDA